MRLHLIAVCCLALSCSGACDEDSGPPKPGCLDALDEFVAHYSDEDFEEAAQLLVGPQGPKEELSLAAQQLEQTYTVLGALSEPYVPERTHSSDLWVGSVFGLPEPERRARFDPDYILEADFEKLVGAQLNIACEGRALAAFGYRFPDERGERLNKMGRAEYPKGMARRPFR